MTFAFAFVAACGDNIHPANGDGGSDGSGGSDAPTDGPRDAAKMDAPDATMCPSGDNVCNGVCSDPNTDDHNCGACAPPNGSGTDCTTTSQVCTNGICCVAGQINANGICCNAGEVNSSGHCCASGDTYDNGICCPAGQYNAGGAAAPLCCNTGDSACNGACVNEQTDNNHCGDCSTTCNTAAGEACSNGHCCASPDIYCGGACVDPTTDTNNCGACGTTCSGTDTCSSGHCCPSGTTYDGGLCCAAGTQNVGGLCCPPGDSNCGGTCVNEQTDGSHCGSCTNMCPGGDACVVGQCCPTGDNVCGGACSNPGTDNNNCGACGNACGSSASCSAGLCCPTGTVNTGGICCAMGTFNVGGICCPSAADTNCGGTCADLTTDTGHCGTCANACPGGDSCDSGTCCPTGDNLCNGACSDPKTDPNNCGGCTGAGGTDCTASGKTCSNGICCSGTQYNSSGICCDQGTYNSSGKCCPNGTTNCNGTCVDTSSNNSNCGSCGNACIAPKTCDGTGNCSASCATGTMYCAGTNTCSNTQTDNQNCGSCGNACTGGQTCVSGVCGCNTAPFTTNCSGTCVDLDNDVNHCGTCTGVCQPGQTCDTTTPPTTPVAICCDLGLSVCGTSCVDFQSDPANCGSCGNACGSGASCVAGACTCPFGEISCGGGGCKTATVDPANCGSCGNVCGAGPNAGKPYCVSNSCVATCPAPLCPYGSGATATCGDPLDDNKHCGKATSTNPCPATVDCTATGQVCAAGQCVTGITTTGTPAKCVNGGPPIIVPGSGGTTDCAGNLADVSFTFGLCSCTDIGPLSRLVQTDAFNSAIGAYRGPGFAGSGPPTGACNTASDCAKECSVTNQPCAQDSNCPSGETCTRFPIPCILHTCAGGGVGTDGTTNDTDNMNIGGDLWVFSTAGEQTKADTNVLEHFYDNGPLVYAKTLNVEGDAHVVGGFSQQGGSSIANIGQNPITGETGTLYTTVACGSLPTSLKLFGNPMCTQQPVTFAQPCDCTNLVPIKDIIIPYFAANNDDSAIGVTPSLFDNTSGNVRLDLVCGAYYFHTLNASGATITIVVHGHVGLFISGAMRISQNVVFDLDPTATLDIFVGGAVNVSGSTVLGSPAFPRYTRLYIGSGGCTGGGGVCSVAEDCCGGVCSGGTCQGGGGNLGQAMSLSNSGGFNGLVYAGYGTFTHSNPLEMYGSIFTGHYDASGTTTIHYDNGVVSAPNECPPPSGKCDTCADCDNNPCVLGNCQANCTDDAQCCPPLHCLGTTGSKTCQL